MDQPTLIGTGFVVLAAVVWIVCAAYAYQNAAKLGRNRIVWTILCAIFGPIALMILYVLPKRQPAPGSGGSKHADNRDSLYEVPKKRR